jgi:hypothetical protein
MSDNYIVINGKRTELTDEQLKALGIEVRKNPFERVEPGDDYYYVSSNNDVGAYTDSSDGMDNRLYAVSNYFNDKDFAKQVALHQLLYRKLLKFAYDNNCEDDQPWDCGNRHYHVYYSHAYKIFTTELNYEGKHPGVYFPSPEAAKRAIKEVIEPFVKKHPEFVW